MLQGRACVSAPGWGLLRLSAALPSSQVSASLTGNDSVPVLSLRVARLPSASECGCDASGDCRCDVRSAGVRHGGHVCLRQPIHMFTLPT